MQSVYKAKGVTLVEQYFDVGMLFEATIKQSVKKIEKSRSKLLQVRRSVAERAWENLSRQSELGEFVACFKAWCSGAQITPKQGMWLMADNLSGCQTMIVRYRSGAALLHTEEEFRDATHIELHMTSPQTIQFLDNGEPISSLVYNNLFPGAGLYGWKKDFIVAVDSIFLREDGISEVKNPVLANVVAWLVWRMQPSEANPEKIVALVKKIGELVDGYAINVVRRIAEEISGYKLVLARTEAKITYLEKAEGSYLKQVNIIDPKEMTAKWALPPRNIWRGGWRYFTGRLKTLDSHASKYASWCQARLATEYVEAVHREIQGMIYGELSAAYVHPDLGAMCVGFVDLDSGTSVSCKLNDHKDKTVIEYLDWVK